MKVMLINPPIREIANPFYFPAHLGYIAGALLKAGHKIEILEWDAYRYTKEKAEEIIKNSDCKLFGIGGLITTYSYVIWLCDTIKKHHPDRKIIVGGGIASSIPDFLLEKSKTDMVCLGEGEEAIVEVADKIKQGEDTEHIQNIWTRRNKNPVRPQVKNLDKLAWPPYHLFPMEIYLKHPSTPEFEIGKRTLSIISSRGCPFKCTYCHRTIRGKTRYRSPPDIVNELIFLKKNYKIEGIMFLDELTLMKEPWVTELCDLMIKNKLNLKWSCTGRANITSEKMFQKLKEAGCTTITFGVESADPRILKEMNKQITPGQARNAIKMIRKAGIRCNTTYIFGMPGETEESVQNTVDFIKEMDVKLGCFFCATPYPGTQLYEDAVKAGKIKDKEAFIRKLGDATDFVINLTKWSDEDFHRIRTRAQNEAREHYFKNHKFEYLFELKNAAKTIPRFIKLHGIRKTLGKIKERILAHLSMWRKK